MQQVQYKPDVSSGTTHISTYAYDQFGRLASTRINDNRPRTVSFDYDANGEAIRRDEADGNGSVGDPHEVWYRFAGQQVANTGNDVTLDTSYYRSIWRLAISAAAARLRRTSRFPRGAARPRG